MTLFGFIMWYTTSNLISQWSGRDSFNVYTKTVPLNHKIPTIRTISRCPWLAARCKAVSSPILVALMRAPLMINMSTIFAQPSLAAQ